MSILSERLKKLREISGKSQKEVALELKIKPTAFSNYETGEREPGIEILNKFANIYNVSVDFLSGNSDYPNPSLNEYISKKYNISNNEALEGFKDITQKEFDMFFRYNEYVKLPEAYSDQQYLCFNENSFYNKMVNLNQRVIEYVSFTLDFNAKIGKTLDDVKNYRVKKEEFITDINSLLRFISFYPETNVGVTMLSVKLPAHIIPEGYDPTEETQRMLSIQCLSDKGISVDGVYEKKE